MMSEALGKQYGVSSQKPTKLSDEMMAELKELYSGIVSHPEDHARAHMQLLFSHIAAMEAEQKRVASRTASDAFEVGAANMKFNDAQTERIRELEKENRLLKQLAVAVDRQARTWGISSLQDGVADAFNEYMKERQS